MTYSDEVLADSPLVYWRLEETTGDAADSSGNGREGSWGSLVTREVGLLGAGSVGAAGFPGSGSSGDTRISHSYAAWMSPATLTLEAWIKPTDTEPGTRKIASRYYLGGVSNPGNRAWYLAHNGTGLRAAISVNGTTSTTTLAAQNVLQAGVVTHVVMTYDGTTLRLYVDGDEAAAESAAGVLNAGVQPLYIGVTPGANSYKFIGVIDEFAMYDHALSPERIAAHYAAGTAAPGPEPVVVEAGIAVETDTALATTIEHPSTFSTLLTIPAGKVATDLPGFVTRVNLADLPSGFWADFDGGNVRVTQGGTPVPVDVVWSDIGNQSGELFFKADLLAASDNVFSVEVAPGQAAPDGTEVWSDYATVIGRYSLADRTGKTAGGVVVDSAGGFDAEGRMSFASNGVVYVTGLPKLTTWIMGCHAQHTTVQQDAVLSYTENNTSDNAPRMTILRRTGNHWNLWNSTDTFLSSGVGGSGPLRVHAQQQGATSRQIFVDGVLRASGSTAQRPGGLGDTLVIGGSENPPTEQWDGYVTQVYLRNGTLSDEWVAAEVLSWETPQAFYTVDPGTTPVTVEVGVAVETDTALAATVVTDGALSMGVAVETDTALAATVVTDEALSMGVAVETDTALAATVVTDGDQALSMGVAVETDTALPAIIVGEALIVEVGVAVETDTARPTMFRDSSATETVTPTDRLREGIGYATWDPPVVEPPDGIVYDYIAVHAYTGILFEED